MLALTRAPGFLGCGSGVNTAPQLLRQQGEETILQISNAVLFFFPVIVLSIIFLCHLFTTPYDILFGSRVTNCYLANIWFLGSLQITDGVFDLTWPRPATKLLFLSSSWYFLWDSLSTEVLDLSSYILTTDLT